MTTYNTGKPVGSADPRDLYDNAQNLDTLLNSQEKLEHDDRLAVPRKTWHGMEQEFNATQAEKQQRFSAFLANSGYESVGVYTEGLEIAEYNQGVIDDNGEFWRLAYSVELPYTTTGAGLPEGGAFVFIGEGTLRQELADGKAEVSSFTGVGQPISEALDQRTICVGSLAERDALPTAMLNPNVATVSVKGALYLWTGIEFMCLVGTLLAHGAVGDGVTDDTQAWNDFQEEVAAIKAIAPGRYLVNGELRRFDSGCVGNGNFLDEDAAWDQPQGDRERNGILVHRNEIDVNTQAVSPIIKTQVHTNWQRDTSAGSFKHVLNAYHEATLDGYYNVQADTNQNFTVSGSAVLNRMAGLFGSLAHLAYCEDVDRTANPDIVAMGGTKNGCSFMRFTKRGLYEDGGYMFGLEVYGLNSANEATDVPYQNDDAYGFTTWTSMLKLTAGSSGAPISSALFTSGLNTKHGMWNGLVIGASSFRINNDGNGAAGTVGLNLASWRTERGWADIGIKFRSANRHTYYREGHKSRSELTRLMYESGDCGLAVESGTGSSSYIHLRTGNTADPDGGSVATQGQVDANATWTRLQSNSGEVQLSAQGTVYAATTKRFAPAIALDNMQALGGANRRWAEVFAVTGTINTSDERAKQDIQDLDEAELRVAQACKKLIKKYRWRDVVAEKGDDARWHFGVIAQEVIAAFEAEGLDAHRYGIICHDAWEAESEQVHITKIPLKPAVYEQVLVKPASSSERVIEEAVYDDKGELIKKAVTETVEEEAVYKDGKEIEPEQFYEQRTVTPAVESGERYGVRYDELFAFIIAAL